MFGRLLAVLINISTSFFTVRKQERIFFLVKNICLKIRMIDECLQQRSLAAIVLQALINQVKTQQRKLYCLWKLIIALSQVLFEVSLVSACKWRKSSEHFIEDTP